MGKENDVDVTDDENDIGGANNLDYSVSREDYDGYASMEEVSELDVDDFEKDVNDFFEKKSNDTDNRAGNSVPMISYPTSHLTLRPSSPFLSSIPPSLPPLPCR